MLATKLLMTPTTLATSPTNIANIQPDQIKAPQKSSTA